MDASKSKATTPFASVTSQRIWLSSHPAATIERKPNISHDSSHDAAEGQIRGPGYL